MSIQEKRERLKNISNQAAEIREKMLHACKNDTEIQEVNALTVNNIIIEHIYKDEKNQEFKTFKGWLKDSKCVKKGETAFLIWGRPKAVQEKEKNPKAETTEEENNFFPISFIFSNAQVKTITENA